MIVDQTTLDSALDLARLDLPATPRVTALRGEDYTDTSGDETIRIHILLDEAADMSNVSGRDVGELKNAIRKSLHDHGVTVFPYFKLAKPSELGDQTDEE